MAVNYPLILIDSKRRKIFFVEAYYGQKYAVVTIGFVMFFPSVVKERHPRGDEHRRFLQNHLL
jgi:hypothetical protein